MARQELSLNDYKTELEKMIAKEKYDKANVDSESEQDSVNDSNISGDDRELTVNE